MTSNLYLLVAKIIPTHVLLTGVGGRGVAVDQFSPTARFVRR